MRNLPVSYEGVMEALPRVRAALKPTPLYEWSGLSKLLGCQYFVKHENHQPVGAFKIRGGITDSRSLMLLGSSESNARSLCRLELIRENAQQSVDSERS
jgi:threonine dehydratase